MNNFFISIYSWFCNWSDNETVFKIMDAVKDIILPDFQTDTIMAV